MSSNISDGACVQSFMQRCDRVYRQTAGFVADFANRDPFRQSNRFAVQQPANIDRDIPLGHHALYADRVAGVGRLVSERERMYLRKDCVGNRYIQLYIYHILPLTESSAV